MNNKIIYIKYSELTLKKNNRSYFINTLFNNIKYALNSYNVGLKKYHDYMVIDKYDLKSFETILKVLKQIPGIQYITIAYKLEKNLDSVKQFILNNKEMFENYSTFKVNSKRVDKGFEFNSLEISKNIGGFILQNFNNLKVDISNPELILNIEVKNDSIFLFFNKIECSKGLPVGTSDKILVLLSGGIDSPVASKLMLNRGMEVIFLTFITPPHTCNNALEKTKELVRKITLDFKLSKNSKLIICNYTQCMHEISHTKNESYRITLMRRSFIRIAKKIAIQNNCLGLCTGESLGQVASQTIQSLNVINEAAESFLILRPLIGMDKNTIIKYAKEFDTYEISIKDFPDSCSLFAPKNPVTMPKLSTCIELEEQLEILKSLEQNTLEKKIEEWVLKNE